MAQISCRDLSLGYDTGAILEHLNFEVNAGDYLCIVGENGSGKTTLMRTLLHLLQPLKGTVQLGDGLMPNEIGYLPQQTVVQRDFPASVREIVLSGCQGRTGLRPFYSRAEKQLAKKNLERMGIEDLAERCYRELSGGQQQRVLLARALCAAGRLLLMDEPFTGLDPTVANELYEVVDRLNREEGVTVIMVTHDVPEALRHATRILHLGAQHFDGTAEEYRRSPLYRRLMGGESHA